MLIIGERINATRKSIKEAIEKKDVRFIQQEAINQVNSGADMLDVNCGIDIRSEPENMEWLVKIVQEKVNMSLVIDSPSPLALEKGLKVHNGKPIINSITGETETELGKERIRRILPLVKEYDTGIVVITIDEKGMPATAEERFDIVKKMYKLITGYKISPENIYFDLLVRPISVESKQVIEFLKAVKLVKTNFPELKTVCGLSNVSFGLPNRRLINSTFLVLCLHAGLDAALIDPTDKNMIASLKTTEALLGKDEYCLNYITAHKEGKF